MHKAENIYFLIIKKKRDGPRQGVAQGRVPYPTRFQYQQQKNCRRSFCITLKFGYQPDFLNFA